MDKSLRVLIIEDSEDDALLAVAELQQGGYTTAWKRIETSEDMDCALKNEAWDVILSDHRMPRFSSFEALELLRQAGLDLPFIVVSGTIGEETAVELLKAGAYDCVMKSNLKRLVFAVERALQFARERREHRQAEELLHTSEERYRTLLESASEGIIVADVETRQYIYMPILLFAKCWDTAMKS